MQGKVKTLRNILYALGLAWKTERENIFNSSEYRWPCFLVELRSICDWKNWREKPERNLETVSMAFSCFSDFFFGDVFCFCLIDLSRRFLSRSLLFWRDEIFLLMGEGMEGGDGASTVTVEQLGSGDGVVTFRIFFGGSCRIGGGFLFVVRVRGGFGTLKRVGMAVGIKCELL